VLNCFAYTGAFAVYALAAGAKSVTNVDTSADALAIARRNVELNQAQSCHSERSEESPGVFTDSLFNESGI
jgi:23S rRNA (cytosine1962-C5)-methyltransferase